jgi:hypothetical protein
MTLTIMQPAYLPWLGFFERVLLSDVFVVLDNVQLDSSSKTNFTTRNKIRTPQGATLLTVPVKKKGNHGSLFIDQLEISNESNWKQKHWDSIKQFYAKAPFFREHRDFFEALYQKEHLLLAGLMEEIITYLIGALKINTKLIYSSSLENIHSAKDNLIADICTELNASIYISGPFGRDYLDRQLFKQKNIRLLFHDYKHPEYKQVFPGFEPYMSAIDLLFNHGPESASILNTTLHASELPK